LVESLTETIEGTQWTALFNVQLLDVIELIRSESPTSPLASLLAEALV
jgi:hypothetical protein